MIIQIDVTGYWIPLDGLQCGNVREERPEWRWRRKIDEKSFERRKYENSVWDENDGEEF